MCDRCPTDRIWAAVRSALALLACMLALVLFLYVTRRAPAGALRPLIHSSQLLQVILLYDVDWPDSFPVLSNLFLGLNFDMIRLAGPACMGVPLNYFSQLGLMIGSTTLILVLPWLSTLWRFLRRRAAPNGKERLEQNFRLRLQDCTIVVLLVHPTVTGYAFNFFNCKFLEDPSGTHTLSNRTGMWYVNMDAMTEAND
jgi:hypothetical protein